MDLLPFLKEWLTEHIKVTDRKYVKAMKKTGIK